MTAGNAGSWAAVLAACAFIAAAHARLPAPTEEQKAKMAEAKTKAGESVKRQADLLGKAQDRAVERYLKVTGKGADAPAVASAAPEAPGVTR
jgi:hypothetical protein